MHRRETLLRYVTFASLIAIAVFTAIHSPRTTLADPAPPLTSAAAGPRWRIHIRAFPDGVGAGGQRCQGCDGSYTGADQFVAATKPLRDVNVVVLGYQQSGTGHQATWEQVELWRGNIAQPNSRHPEAEHTIVLDQPPPYTVYLSKNPDGYALCPTAPQWRNFEPKDFRSPGSRASAGGQVELSWFFWSCAGEKLGQDLNAPNEVLGGVLCGIYCWIDRARGGPGCSPTPDPSCGSATATPVP